MRRGACSQSLGRPQLACILFHLRRCVLLPSAAGFFLTRPLDGRGLRPLTESPLSATSLQFVAIPLGVRGVSPDLRQVHERARRPAVGVI